MEYIIYLYTQKYPTFLHYDHMHTSGFFIYFYMRVDD